MDLETLYTFCIRYCMSKKVAGKPCTYRRFAKYQFNVVITDITLMGWDVEDLAGQMWLNITQADTRASLAFREAWKDGLGTYSQMCKWLALEFVIVLNQVRGQTHHRITTDEGKRVYVANDETLCEDEWAALEKEGEAIEYAMLENSIDFGNLVKKAVTTKFEQDLLLWKLDMVSTAKVCKRHKISERTLWRRWNDLFSKFMDSVHV